MSTTPRTDAVWADKKQNILEHARQLETELITLQEENTKQKELLRSVRQSANDSSLNFRKTEVKRIELERERDQLLATVEGLKAAWDKCKNLGWSLEVQKFDDLMIESAQSLPPTNFVKRSVLEKLYQEVSPSYGRPTALREALKEAHEELERTKQ